MKKLHLAGLTALFLGLCGCSDGNESEQQATASASINTTQVLQGETLMLAVNEDEGRVFTKADQIKQISETIQADADINIEEFNSYAEQSIAEQVEPTEQIIAEQIEPTEQTEQRSQTDQTQPVQEITTTIGQIAMVNGSGQENQPIEIAQTDINQPEQAIELAQSTDQQIRNETEQIAQPTEQVVNETEQIEQIAQPTEQVVNEIEQTAQSTEQEALPAEIDQTIMPEPMVEEPVEQIPVETPVEQIMVEPALPPIEDETTLASKIAQEAMNIAGNTEGMQCTEVVTQVLQNAGLTNAEVLEPSQYIQYGEYTENPIAGDLVYYTGSDAGYDHIGIYLGNDQALQGNWNGTPEEPANSAITDVNLDMFASQEYIHITE